MKSATNDDHRRCVEARSAHAPDLVHVESMSRIRRAPAANALGAFVVDEAALPACTSGILINDAVDSRWAFTVLGHAPARRRRDCRRHGREART
jgi:hypothetical protein